MLCPRGLVSFSLYECPSPDSQVEQTYSVYPPFKQSALTTVFVYEWGSFPDVIVYEWPFVPSSQTEQTYVQFPVDWQVADVAPSRSS